MKNKTLRFMGSFCLTSYIAIWILLHPAYIFYMCRRIYKEEKSFRPELRKWARNKAIAAETLRLMRRMDI